MGISEFHRAWADHSPIPTGVLREGKFVYVNDTLVALLGRSRDQLIGESIVMPVLLEDRSRIERRHLDRVETRPVPDSYEVTIVREDGEQRRVHLYVSRNGDEFIVQGVDITSLEGRRARLRGLAQLGARLPLERNADAVFDAVMKGLLALDLAGVRFRPDGDGVLVVAESLGDFVRSRIPNADVPEKPARGAWGPALRTAWKERAAFIDDMVIATQRFVGNDDAGAALMLEVGLERGAVVCVDSNGEPSELLMFLGAWLQPEDLPAFTLFAAQVTAAVDGARMMDQLVQRERLAALGELAAVVAHEVRNPLGVLFNSLVAFRRMVKLDDEPARLVEIMNEETERLNRIVGELLDFAKPSTPQLELTSLAPIVEDAVKSALASATSEAAVVWNATRDALPVLADPLLMHQAIVNLVHNALQAMKGTGTLTVVVDRDGPHAYLEIRDDGPGVDETSREKMFEPFFTTKATGTGLGLAIVRRVVSDHRGSVIVKNSPDGGCCVRIVLPVAN